jgi:hypothetical protein
METAVQDSPLEQASEVVEVVILSGPRRGEITHVQLGSKEVLTEEENLLIAGALRELSAAMEGLVASATRLEDTARIAAERGD